MIRLLPLLACFIVSIAIGQTTQEAAVKQTIDTFFEGFHKGDTILMKSVLADKVLLQTAFKNREGKDQLVQDDIAKMLTTIGTRPDDQKWEEKLLDYHIKVDGNMANAWTPYKFWFNGSFSHCGVNSFQLFHDNGTWKIIYLIDTRRREGCQE
ncbi:MAG TPA: nuclear transport factor 2 family protein [Flavobacteriaceae bacterium]|nr:nuclear transport factor 2 family protein [Flavobacteriaceae bacterium]